MRGEHDPVEYRVSDGAFTDQAMPFRYRYLRDQYGGCPVITVLDYIHQHVTCSLVDCRQSEVVEYEQLAAGYFLQQLVGIRPTKYIFSD